MRDPILAGDEDHARRADFACGARVVSGTAVDVDSLVGAVVGFDGAADASDAVRVESDGRAVKGFDPVEGAAFFAFG